VTIGMPDWYISKFRPSEILFPYQDRIWGYTEGTVPGSNSVTVLFWNAESVPEPHPGIAVGVKYWDWVVKGLKVSIDANNLIYVKAGVFTYYDGSIWVTAENRDQGYGSIEFDFKDGLRVYYDEDTPYGIFVVITNQSTDDRTFTVYINGTAYYTRM